MDEDGVKLVKPIKPPSGFIDSIARTFDKAVDGNTVPLVLLGLIAWWVMGSNLSGPAGNIISAIVGAISTYLTKELQRAKDGNLPVPPTSRSAFPPT